VGLVSLLFSFNGRIKRSQYWLGTIGVNVVNWVVLFMTASANVMTAQVKDPAAQLSALASQSAIMIPLSLAVTWAALAIQVKRFHDRGQSGWWTLLPLAPIAFMIMNLFSAIGEGWPIERFVASLGMPFLAFMVICVGFFINLGCLPGTEGPNKYGDPPGSPRSPGADPFKSPRPSVPGMASPPSASLGSSLEAAMERAIAERARQPAAANKPARPAVATAAAAPASSGGFGRRPAR